MTRDGHDADGAAWNAGMHCWRDGSVVMLSSSVVQVSFIVESKSDVGRGREHSAVRALDKKTDDAHNPFFSA